MTSTPHRHSGEGRHCFSTNQPPVIPHLLALDPGLRRGDAFAVSRTDSLNGIAYQR